MKRSRLKGLKRYGTGRIFFSLKLWEISKCCVGCCVFGILFMNSLACDENTAIDNTSSPHLKEWRSEFSEYSKESQFTSFVNVENKALYTPKTRFKIGMLVRTALLSQCTSSSWGLCASMVLSQLRKQTLCNLTVNRHLHHVNAGGQIGNRQSIG